MALDIPGRLYKYLPSRFLDRVVDQGHLLFRNLSYFRKIEEKGRGDPLESLHVDHPDEGITIEVFDTGKRIRGQFSFHNSVKADRILIFCMSTVHAPSLYAEFEADRCIEIVDPVEFVRRCEAKISRQRRFAESGLLHGLVEYYAPNRAAQRNVQDPLNIPFLKHEAYSNQQEFRLVAALRGGLQVEHAIVAPEYNLDDEIEAGVPAERIVAIGSIRDLVRIHHR